MRIYLIGTPDGVRLIRAKCRQDALWYVAEGKYVVRPAKQDDLIEQLSKGVEIETVKNDAQQTLDLGKT